MSRLSAFTLMIVVAALTLPALRSTCAAAPTAADADPHEQLQAILKRPMYEAWRLRQERDLAEGDITIPHGFSDWLAGIGRSIRDFLDWLFRSHRSPSTPSGFSVGQTLPTILKIVAWLALATALIFVTIFVVRLLGKNKPNIPTANILSRRQVHQAMESGDALALDSAQWMDEARRLAEEQNFRAMYRALYLALLSGLHTLGKIEHSRNRTNWAYVQYYRGPSDERAVFADLTELFDRVWYGRKDAGGNDLETLRIQIARLTREGALT